MATTRLWLVVPVILMATSCRTDGGKPPAISLEEARQVVATFEGRSFVPPPKSIDDITEILDKQALTDPESIKRARAKAHSARPAEVDGTELAKFLRQRALAARDIGDVRRQFADLREAERLSRDADAETRMDILLDLSVAEILAGNFADAIRHREQAIAVVPERRRDRRLGMSATISVQYARAGELEIAEAHLANAQALLNEAQFWWGFPRFGTLWTGTVARSRANVLDIKGRFAEAERHYLDAIEKFSQFRKSHPDSIYGSLFVEATQAELAENYLRRDRVVEAEIQARKALTASLARHGRYSQDTALQLKTLVRVISAQGRAAEAERLARALVDIYRKIGAPEDSYQLALARAELAETFISQRKWQPALEVFAAIKDGLASSPETFDQFFAGNLNWALALLRTGDAHAALDVAVAAWDRSRETLGEKHYNTAEAQAVLGTSHVQLGNEEEALAAFTRAVPILLARSRQSDDEGGMQAAKSSRLTTILEAYMALLAELDADSMDAGFDPRAEAFRIADIARGQAVQNALVASAARAAAADPDLAGLVRREQDALKQVGALNGLLARAISVPTDQRNPTTIAELRTNIDRLRDARAVLANEIEQRFPDYAALMNPKPATMAGTRAVLRPGEALIATYVGADRTYIWAIPHSGEPAFASAPLGERSLSAVVGRLRRALDPSAATLGDIPEFDVALAYELFRSLLAPVASGWRGAEKLIFVPHGPLGHLPLSVLVTDDKPLAVEREPLFSNYRAVSWLARRHAVTMVPSVSSLTTLRALPAPRPDRRSFAGFGDPWFNAAQAKEGASKAQPTSSRAASDLLLRAVPKLDGLSNATLSALPRLPETAEEITSIALALNADLTADVFTGIAANEGRVKEMSLSGYRVIAFATHGLVPGDLNGLTQPALALSSPMVSGGDDDGLLNMGEILGLKLDADWVVLSACNTATGQGAGAEAISGLGRAFFYAGTRALLVSSWPVETTSARLLTTDIFQRQSDDATLGRAQALQEAMLSLVDSDGNIDEASGKAVFSYAHPIFWAPFSLVGDGSGGGLGS